MLKRLWYWIFPPRASTQTWMFLTFALFVGLAVVAVGLYLALVLRGEIHRAMQETLRQQAERVAVQMEDALREGHGRRTLRRLAESADLRITAARADSVLWTGPAGTRPDSLFWQRPEMQGLEAADVRYATRTRPDGTKMLAAALQRPGGLIVRVAQDEPPLLDVVRRVQIALAVGMAAALIMALFGSWIAAYQVTTPLKTIRDSARRISEGEFDKKIRVDTRAAEIQDLARNLNTMSESFREQILELERLTELQSEFIGNVGHEVRNPIFAVSGYLEALSSDSLDANQRKKYAEKGLTNLQRLNDLFDHLIEIAQLEYREDLIDAHVFELSEMLGDIEDTLRPKADEKDLDLIMEDKTLFVEADADRVRQVLTNLIENAIAYTDEGTVRCRYRRHVDKVRIEVIDTGKGIPEEHRERIFERFYRVNPDRSRKSGGTGLGLSIVQQIIQAHGEEIHVESTVGRGTRFWFELPYAEEPEPEPA